MCKSAPNCLVENAVSESIASAKLSMARERLNVEQLARVPLYAFAPFCSRKTQKAHSVLEERFSAIGSFSLSLASASQAQFGSFDMHLYNAHSAVWFMCTHRTLGQKWFLCVFSLGFGSVQFLAKHRSRPFIPIYLTRCGTILSFHHIYTIA